MLRNEVGLRRLADHFQEWAGLVGFRLILGYLRLRMFGLGWLFRAEPQISVVTESAGAWVITNSAGEDKRRSNSPSALFPVCIQLVLGDI
jgi:hypothetical protein